MTPKPFPQIEGKRIVRAEIDCDQVTEYGLTLTMHDGSVLRVTSEASWGEDSWLDIGLTYGPG